MKRVNQDKIPEQTASNIQADSTKEISKVLGVGKQQIKGRVNNPTIPDNLRPSADLIKLSEQQKDLPLSYDEKDDVYYKSIRPE
jgi:hypothetical protein